MYRMLKQAFDNTNISLRHGSAGCTCEVDSANGIDVIMDIGWVRPALSAVLPGKFRARALHADAQAISADHS